MNAHRALRGALLVASIGLALHLVFPQIPRIERSLRLISDTSHLLVGTAFVAEVLSELCYAELLGRSVETVSGPGYSFSSPCASREPEGPTAAGSCSGAKLYDGGPCT
jgi:hypothetical protein